MIRGTYINARILAIAAFVSCFCCVSLSQTPRISSEFPALRYDHPEHTGNAGWDIEYLNYAGEPALRIKAHHYHAWCNGYLYFTPSRIAYDPSLTPNRRDGFVVSRSDLSGVRFRFSGIELAWPNSLQRFAFISSPEAGDRAVGDQREALLQFVMLAVKDFRAAQQQFLRTVAGLPAANQGFPETPVISILEPTGASPRATVFARTAQIYGTASAASGIRGVSVNGAPAKLILLSPQIVLFESSALPVDVSVTRSVAVTAQANNAAQSEVAFNIMKPDVRITEPAIGNSTSDAVTTVRGSLFGMHGVQRVRVADIDAVLTQRDDGGIDFEAPKVPLAMGVNLVPGVVATADGQDVTFITEARRTPPGPPPMSLPAILQGLRLHVNQKLIISAINEKGVSFALTDDSEKLLRAEGAEQPLLQAIQQAKR